MEKEGQGKGSLKPARMTRQQARDAEEREAAGGDDAGDEPVEEGAHSIRLCVCMPFITSLILLDAPIDLRAMAEEEDIVPRLPANLNANLASSKWKERKEGLDDLLTLVNATQRIKDAPEIGDLSKTLASKVQSDANINCVMVAAQCIEGLAKAMKGSYGRYRESVVPPMLERLKERKATVTDTIGAALDAVFATVCSSIIRVFYCP